MIKHQVSSIRGLAGLVLGQPAAMEDQALITRDDHILGGVAVFSGTRVPVKTHLDYLAEGHSLDIFLDDFPTVTRRQAQEVLALLGHNLAQQGAT